MLALLAAGFVLLACGTWRQSRILLGRVPSARARTACLLFGFGLLAAGLAAALAGPDPQRGAVEWFGLMTLAALAALGMCWLRDRAR